jgi:hypothetical protein
MDVSGRRASRASRTTCVDCRRLGSDLEKDAICPGYHEIAGGSGGPRSTISQKLRFWAGRTGGKFDLNHSYSKKKEVHGLNSVFR